MQFRSLKELETAVMKKAELQQTITKAKQCTGQNIFSLKRHTASI